MAAKVLSSMAFLLVTLTLMSVADGIRVAPSSGVVESSSSSGDITVVHKRLSKSEIAADLMIDRLKDAVWEEGDDDEEAEEVGQADPDGDDKDFCYDPIYRKRTLKVIKETPFIGLFRELNNHTRFEASGIIAAKDSAFVVFDNVRTIGRIGLDFKFRGEENILIPEEGEVEEESQFEGLSYLPKTDTFIVVRETFNKEHDGHIDLISQTEEVKFNKQMSSFKVIKTCSYEFDFEDVNKGFEGLFAFDKGDKRYMMGLCESNYCRTIQGEDPPGMDPGHGRVVLAEMVTNKTGACSWEVIKVIKIPRKAFFLDYSAMAFNGFMGSTVMISSQENASVWMGNFDWNEMEFVGKGRVLHFPRDEHCGKIYCNVEGAFFIDAQRIVLSSDKSKATQAHSCMHKDQSVAIMALPDYIPKPQPQPEHKKGARKGGEERRDAEVTTTTTEAFETA